MNYLYDKIQKKIKVYIVNIQPVLPVDYTIGRNKEVWRKLEGTLKQRKGQTLMCLIERKCHDVIKFLSQNKQTTTKNDKE